jgi:hypothetical protein
MSEITYDGHPDGDFGSNIRVRAHVFAGKRVVEVKRPGTTVSAFLPKDPAELHKLTEAIHGRKIAGILYEDELPPVRDEPQSGLRAGNSGAGRGVEAAFVWQQARENVAIARAIETRDAAKGAAERKADEVWDQVRALPVRDAVRRAYELGADSERTEAGA